MLLLPLFACAPWDLPANATRYLDEDTWDRDVVPVADSVYVRLPAAGALARVKPDGTWDAVDLDGAAPDRLVAAPDQQTVLAFASWPVCDDDDPKIKYVSDCRAEDLHEGHELDVVRDGEAARVEGDVPSQFNAVAFDAGGTIAVAYLDFSKADTVDIDGVLNLTEAVFVDLSEMQAHAVPVGFAPENVLFNADGTKAVVLSRSQVAVVDLAEWAVDVSFPLTLDPDQEVEPQDVVLVTEDGTDYALVSIQGRSELYVLDLTDESIDIVELDAPPSDLLVDAATDQTVIVYANRAQANLLEHTYFELSTVELDEPATGLLGGDGKVLLYNDGGSYHDVYLLDTATASTTEFRAENPVAQMRITDDGAYAVASLGLETSAASTSGVGSFYDQHYGIDVFDLVGLGDPVALALQGQPVGLETVTGEDGEDYALVLQDGYDKLLKIRLSDAGNDEIELEEPPSGIVAMPGAGLFVVTHPSDLGLLSFIDPDGEDVATVAGFATTGLLTEPVLPRRDAEE